VGARLEGGGGGRWLSSLSTAASEVPPDAESGSADRRVLGGSKEVSLKRNMSEIKGGGGQRERGGGRWQLRRGAP
jgi:hypothetical protein